MKKAILIFAVIVLIGIHIGWAQDMPQNRDFDYTGYGQMIYWKALSLEEKKVFLHAYLYRTYEITEQMRQSRKLKATVNDYTNEIADPVYEVFRDLNETKKEDLIGWIDIFYQQEFNQKETFMKALTYAFGKIKSGDKSLHDVYKRSFPN